MTERGGVVMLHLSQIELSNESYSENANIEAIIQNAFLFIFSPIAINILYGGYDKAKHRNKYN